MSERQPYDHTSHLPPGVYPPGRHEPPLPGGPGSVLVQRTVVADHPVQTDRSNPTLSGGSPAGFWRRGMALGIDIIVVHVMAAVLGSLSATASMLRGGDTAPLQMTVLQQQATLYSVQVLPLLLFCYLFFFTAYGGRTPGKMLLGLCVVHENGSALSWVRALWRTACYLVSLITWGLGFLLAAGPAKRSLHDRLSGTRVVRTGEDWPPSE